MGYDMVILGGGESGTGAALLALKLGLKPFVSDAGLIKPKYKNLLLESGTPFEEGGHTPATVLAACQIVKSPGIPEHASIVAAAREKEIPVISEIEFAGKHSRARKICITGSNGKTTTTLLTHHILVSAGLDCGLAGNVGRSFAAELAAGDHEIFVLEISSFQLDGMFDFKADVAILMNITPDHLDRYDHDFDKYVQSKFRVCRNQSGSDHFIYCYDDPVIRARLNRNPVSSTPVPFSALEEMAGYGAFIRNQEIIIRTDQNVFTMTLEELALQGRHNLYNSMAAGITAKLLDIRNDVIKLSLSDFQNVEHRLEFVASIHGVEYINDSKATNVNSTWYALECMHKKVIWIAGGQDKGNDYSQLEPLVRAKVRAIICLGKDNRKIIKFFADKVESITETTSADDAVKAAYHLARRGEAVLLSPACASFDLFENFEDRGDQFKNAVKSL